ncbi:MAG: 30S ribosomal protein S20 [Candidatus Pacebacteria bacterium]|jgi:small subunit ribosomal protein S20|nr:30S ribosomal protein S20 [Candidatus Paceibacterota bacterium]MDD5012841.1 30S ribosomal protein S20 [Candidatus Paceibacterota bacterium]MDD5752846.1 30S ribosomal protein S20 [Candidatus Paceibacterota bacterium]
MPIKISAKKQLRQSLKRKKGNDIKKKNMKELIKKADILFAEGKKEELEKMIPSIYKAIDKATKTGIIKKNTAGRKKSRIAKNLNK